MTLYHVYIYFHLVAIVSQKSALACASMLAVWCNDVCVIIYSLICPLIICASLFMSLLVEPSRGSVVANIKCQVQ